MLSGPAIVMLLALLAEAGKRASGQAGKRASGQVQPGI
jgi:hypothetical protein